jgi:hypothetical protein
MASASAVSRAAPGTADPVRGDGGGEHGDCGDPPGAALRHEQAPVLVAADVAALDATPADQRLHHRARQGAHPVRHRPGPRLGHRRLVLPRRVHGLPLRPVGPVPHRGGGHPHRAARHARLRTGRRGHSDPVPPARGSYRRAPRAGGCGPVGHGGGVGAALGVQPRAPRFPPQAHHDPTAAQRLLES